MKETLRLAFACKVFDLSVFALISIKIDQSTSYPKSGDYERKKMRLPFQSTFSTSRKISGKNLDASFYSLGEINQTLNRFKFRSIKIFMYIKKIKYLYCTLLFASLSFSLFFYINFSHFYAVFVQVKFKIKVKKKN